MPFQVRVLSGLRNWPPIGLALAIQAGWLLPSVALSWWLLHAGITGAGWAGLLLQSLGSCVLAARLGQPAWWWPVHLLLPPLALVLLFAGVSAWWYLGAFVLLSAVYWTTFQTRVPLYLSGPALWERLVERIPDGQPLRIADLGSGLGGVALFVARSRPLAEVTGFEVAPLPYLISRLRQRFVSGQVHFRREDFWGEDLGPYDYIFAYLSPAPMPALWFKACTEMRHGAWLFSYRFPVPDVTPTAIWQDRGGKTLYGYRMPCGPNAEDQG